MPLFDISEKRPSINIFKLGGAYYFKHFFEDPAPYTVEISRYQKYGELLKNSVESYPLRDKILLVMKDMAGVEQAVAMGAVVRGGK
jgi:hypothetical protein